MTRSSTSECDRSNCGVARTITINEKIKTSEFFLPFMESRTLFSFIVSFDFIIGKKKLKSPCFSVSGFVFCRHRLL